MTGTTEHHPAPPPIESLSERELRQETVERINTSLSSLPFGPVADGTGCSGYNRPEQDLPSLCCSYFQFSKAYEGKNQVGVQIALLGLFDAYNLHMYQSIAEQQLRRTPSSEKEQEEVNRAIKHLRQIQEAVAKDSIAPAENRYYYIPTDPIQPALVSTESFIARAHRINPQAAENFFLSESITEAQRAENKPIDETSGQPRSKLANLQDFRDALAIVRDGDWFVKMIIEKTPKEAWGRPGLTD